ncbi:MAG: phosphatase PAP2 family protein [Phreatobacter sp.]|uniref:phosphatase PAP2 family protein n=1 Tax=Phreatobacter sp. TaxID=1966341 RepID=UPI0040361A79
MSITPASAPAPARLPAVRAVIASMGRPAIAIWATVAVLALLVAVTYPLAGLRLSLRDVALNAGLSAVLLAGAAYYTFLRPDERIARLLHATPQFVLMTFLGGALSYAAMATNLPLWDATFDAMDKAIGFDWPALLAWTGRHPDLAFALKLAYASMLPQMALVIVALVTVRAFCELDRFVLAFGLAALMTMAICAVTPALCAGYFYREAVATQPHLGLTWNSVAHVLALRSGEMTFVSMATAEGIVTMPSFHTVCAILFAVALWPVRWLRWPGLGLNLAMLAATPIIGGHYLVDLIAGLGVALAARWLAVRLIPSAATEDVRSAG